MAILQDLQLEVGERATCSAGYPHRGTIMVECIKDFDTAPDAAHIINNPLTYIKIIDSGKYGALTSHYISANWATL